MWNQGKTPYIQGVLSLELCNNKAFFCVLRETRRTQYFTLCSPAHIDVNVMSST